MARLAMRRARAVILVFGAIASTAPSWTGSARDAWTLVTTAYAPAQDDGPSNGAIVSLGAAAARSEGEDSGNPLWAVPLESLAETRNRPLFSSSRRPPPIAPPAAPPPAPPAQNLVPVAQTQPEKPPWTLIGTIVSPAARLAIVQNAGTLAFSRVRVGDEDSGWRVRSVAARSIVVEKGATTVTLEIRRLSGTDAPPPP